MNLTFDAARVMAEFDRADGCWEWTGRRDRNGYGLVAAYDGDRQTSTGAHRAVYLTLVGAIPPAHLEPVTYRENSRRGDAGKHLKDKMHCPQGHAYDGENLYVNPNTGRRTCRTCMRVSQRRFWARKREVV